MTVIGATWRRLGSLPAGVAMGALCGAVVGGVLGRLYMRLIFLLDPDKDGAKTDFGTVGEVTVGGSLTLAVACAITGAMGGGLYVVVRRWLPGGSTRARGAAFGLLVGFGPGVIFLGEIDLRVFEPALPIFLGFEALMVLYGVGVALLTDRVSPPATTLDRSGRARWAVMAAGFALVVFAVLVMGGVYEDRGTCLSADGVGGCAIDSKG